MSHFIENLLHEFQERREQLLPSVLEYLSLQDALQMDADGHSCPEMLTTALQRSRPPG
jgi:hypothetical protein